MGLFSKKRQRSPSGTASGQPCAAAAAATGACELREKDPARPRGAATLRHLAWLRRWCWCLRRVGIHRTPLHLACANGHVDVVRFLVEANCLLNLGDNRKRSPLMKAVQHQQEECVAILLEHGADPDLADADGNTALHLAVLSANTAIAGLLLEHRANTDAQNQGGYTPLNLAVSKHREEMVELLQRKAADGHAQDQRESTLLAGNVDGKNTEESCAGGAEGALPAGGAEREEDALSPKDFEEWVAQLQHELISALKKQSRTKASLRVTLRYESDLQEDKLRLQEELDRIEDECRELEEQHLLSQRCVRALEKALDKKEREVRASSRKLRDLLLASSRANTTVKQLEEHVQRLEIENARLEATVQQQGDRIEALQRVLQASASTQKRNVQALTSKDSPSMWEKELKRRSHLEEHVGQSDRERAKLRQQLKRQRRCQAEDAGAEESRF